MGTTLTGTTPQDTYDSLIKVTDNGPLSGTLKTLTDGLGNDSALALSTGAASITGTLAVSSNGLFGGSTNAGNAGTNTISVGVAGTSTGGLQLWAGSGQTHYVQFGDGTTGGQPYAGYVGYNHTADSLIFGSASADRLTITSAGNVGIGTSSPSYKLDVSGISSSNTGFLISSGQYDNIGQTPYTGMFMTGSSSTDGFGALLLTSRTDLARPIIFGTSNGSISVERVRIDANGLKFNGDTAAANALDDYEEGTFTPTAIGATTAGTTTYTNQFGWYTKVGRQVNITLYVDYSDMTGTGGFRIGGLPFTSANSTQNYVVGAVNISNLNWSGGSYITALLIPNSQTIAIYGSSDDAVAVEQSCVNEAASFRITMTYFV